MEKDDPEFPEAEFKSFLDFILSLKKDLSLDIPLLRDLAALIVMKEISFSENNDLQKDLEKKNSVQKNPVHKDPVLKSPLQKGPIQGKIDRLYRRLCRVQEELGRLDLKKGSPEKEQGRVLEDIVFSGIDFSRYGALDEKDFENFFMEGLDDFNESIFIKNFGLKKEAVFSLLKRGYEKIPGSYRLSTGLKSGDIILIISVMRTLDTSPEMKELFEIRDIQKELRNLFSFLEDDPRVPGSPLRPGIIGIKKLYRLLVSGLDNVQITHEDGMTTKLFVNSQLDLAGTFRPDNKPWTRVLILTD